MALVIFTSPFYLPNNKGWNQDAKFNTLGYAKLGRECKFKEYNGSYLFRMD